MIEQLNSCGRHGGMCLLLFVFLVTSALAVESPITALAFAPDGKSVVAVSQSGVHIVGWPKLDRQRLIRVSMANLHCVAFSPNGKHVAIGGGNPSEDGIVAVYTWPAAELVTTFDEHTDSVRSIGWQDDSHLLSASIDREIKLWKIGGNSATQSNSKRTFNGHSRSVDAICLVNDGQLFASAGADQSVRVWDLATGKLIRSLSQHTKPINALAVRPIRGGLPMVASAAGDRTIRFWQPTIGRMVRYVRLDAQPLDIAWLGDGSKIFASCTDGRVRVVDPASVKVMQTINTLSGWAYAIAVHPSDKALLVGGSDGQLQRMTWAKQ